MKERTRKYTNIIIVLVFILILIIISLNIKSLKNRNNEHYYTKTTNLSVPLAGHKTYLLKENKVLVFGGFSNDKTNESVFILDLKNKKCDKLKTKINYITPEPIVLNKDKIIFFEPNQITILNPEKLTFKRIVDIKYKNMESITPILLKNGKILILKWEYNGKSYFKLSKHIFDPKDGTFNSAESNIVINSKYKQPTPELNYLLLKNGNILLFAEYNKHTHIYLYNTGQHKLIKNIKMKIPRYNFKSVLLDNGNVLIIGGLNAKDKIIKNSEIFNPNLNTFMLSSALNSPRIMSATLRLNNGNTLIAGGIGENGEPVLQTEIYDTKSKSFVKHIKINVPRKTPELLEIKNDIILIYGGVKGNSFAQYIVPEVEVCTNGNCEIKNLPIFNRYYYDLIKTDSNTLLLTGGGYTENTSDSYINIFKDCYLIDIKKLTIK